MGALAVYPWLQVENLSNQEELGLVGSPELLEVEDQVGSPELLVGSPELLEEVVGNLLVLEVVTLVGSLLLPEVV